MLIEFGCKFCWDSRQNKAKELFFLDKANNMRLCNYCPNCGRHYGDEEEKDANTNEQLELE